MPAPNPVRELIRRALLDQAPGGSYQERFELYEGFLNRPILQADLDPATINQAALRLLTGANTAWSLAGTNAANAGSSLDVDGGIALTTAGADNDQMLLQPATAINSVEQSPFRRVDWNTGQEVRFETLIELPSIAAIQIKAGLGLTNALDRTTDADQVGIMFDAEGATSTANWTAIESVGGTDEENDTGVAALAAKTIRLGIFISSSRTPRYYVNSLKVHTGNTLTDDISLIPFFGVQALAIAAKTLKVRGVRLSRTLVAAS